jgi:aspartate aminotransferase
MELSIKAREITPSSTLSITAKAKQMKAEGIDVVGFVAGEPDFDTPIHIKEAAIAAICSGFTKYTEASGIIPLRKAIAEKLKNDNNVEYDYTQIIVSNGGKHSLTNVFSALLNPSDEVIIPSPFWLSYPQMVKLADGVPVIVKTKKENSFKITKEEFEKAISKKTKAIIINNPNNPTGMVYTRQELEAIAQVAIEHDIFVVSDEMYEKLVYDNIEYVSIASLNNEIYKRTIIVNGLSKSYAMTGWRVGYTACCGEIATIMSNIQSHSASNINSIAQMAALTAITGPQQCVEDMRVEFERRRNYMVDRINQLPRLSIVEPSGAFYVFINISQLIGKTVCGIDIMGSAEIGKVLLEKYNVAVIPCTDFGFDTHIRLSYAISMENIKSGLDRIEKFLTENDI